MCGSVECGNVTTCVEYAHESGDFPKSLKTPKENQASLCKGGRSFLRTKPYL
ncbi:hypothetical protein K443DRAFT_684904 [Laccaria amethystina LaAM-08-1]|uniref:Unplaced genomic scaffold K443scaffold_339, whole genome shotgun sequence n=1 Tax=Laccaria amethystina LaAM-08-1 TaxID=1095629 RepID=A0A0C9WIH4_9AGAR|nr:hypothetical protein K443DRAFT_684904 [Laccaria amethystina LaAM-08-1]